MKKVVLAVMAVSVSGPASAGWGSDVGDALDPTKNGADQLGEMGTGMQLATVAVMISAIGLAVNNGTMDPTKNIYGYTDEKRADE